ncbi:MAG TPA: hypothetical protein VE134_06280, partial [Methanomicrobiales archaeon]|nr:hypothetical protein [Methanomicrobiales archaeon]
GLLALTIVPGIFIALILGFQRANPVKMLLVAFGLNISFLMLFGYLLNLIYPMVRVPAPLSTMPLTLSLNLVLIPLGIIALYKADLHLPRLKDLRLSGYNSTLFAILFPLISISGVILLNQYQVSTVLVSLLLLIVVYIAYVSLRGEKGSIHYPSVIFLIGISLLVLQALRSDHIIGSDAHYEYQLFQLVMGNGLWQVYVNNPLDACLSISILPTVYAAFLPAIQPEMLFKVLYSVLFSISPLVVFMISRIYIKDTYAFIAAVFFMSQNVFLNASYNPRTTVAILFFALVIWVVLDREIQPLQRSVLFFVFSTSTIVSHYATAFIFAFMLIAFWLFIAGLPLIFRKGRVKEIRQGHLAQGFSLYRVLFFSAVLFLWYGQVTAVPFQFGVYFFQKTYVTLSNFFVLESRGPVAQALGSTLSGSTIPQYIEFAFSWLTVLGITLGIFIVAYSVWRRRKSDASSL